MLASTSKTVHSRFMIPQYPCASMAAPSVPVGLAVLVRGAGVRWASAVALSVVWVGSEAVLSVPQVRAPCGGVLWPWLRSLRRGPLAEMATQAWQSLRNLRKATLAAFCRYLAAIPDEW